MGDETTELKHFRSDTFEIRGGTETCKISDISKINKTAVSFQQDVNRYNRGIKNELNTMNGKLDTLANNTNAGFTRVSTEVDDKARDLSDKIAAIELKSTAQETQLTTLVRDMDIIKIDVQNLAGPRIMTLTTDYNLMKMEPYTGLTSTTFEQWSRKFNDYVEALGRNWNEAEKLGRLKLLLDGTPRQVLDELAAGEKDTLEHALANLKDKIDSPQRKDLAKQNLATCRQRTNEDIQSFTERLLPLVNAAITDPDARRERTTELFLEKINEGIKRESKPNQSRESKPLMPHHKRRTSRNRNPSCNNPRNFPLANSQTGHR
jgi:hypothetical protein